ncbi:MAG: TIGR00153 family protein [Magnetococcales bacterium]|nr:TIGR00153 family protein [Magnetococcales bacterium]
MVSSNPLSNLFGKSPFKPLQQHMRQAVECAGEIPGLFEALNSGDQARIKSIQARIDELENQADQTKDQLRAHLPKSLFMPIDRRDLLEMLDIQDDIADKAQDIAGLISDRTMEVPVGMAEPLVALAKGCVEACDSASKIIEELDELVEMGFGGRESTRVLEMVDALTVTKKKNSEMTKELIRNLFSHEDEIKPVSVVLWYQMINWIGDLSDDAEKVGGRLRLLLAR